MSPPLSVVIATHNRQTSLERLLEQMAVQTLRPEQFEVVVVDDGSVESVAERLTQRAEPYAITIVSQKNAGAAAARHRGIERASGEIVVVVDDDMQIAADFLARHLEMHPTGTRNAVLGRICPDPSAALPLFERFHAAALEDLAAEARKGHLVLYGTHLATGNVSFRRADYFSVGGFDVSLKHSEDAELGVRLQKAGVSLKFSEGACTVHSSDHVSLKGWLRRAFLYGVCDQQIARKHPDVLYADPWRYLFQVHPISRPLLLASVLAPWLTRPLGRLAMTVALGADRLGAHRLAIFGTTLVYGVEYFSGVRHQAGSLREALADFRRYWRRQRVTP
jgi:glycosyltransferase involved in cell wall biosynthesis